MSFSKHVLPIGLLSGLMFVACNCSKTDPPPPPSSTVCQESADCGDVRFYTCDVASGTCVPSCTVAADCQAHPAASGGPLDQCQGKLGCVCDEGECKARLCTVDADCGSSFVCASGGCVTPPDVATVTRCEVAPAYQAMRSGSDYRFSVQAYAGTTPVVVAANGITWKAADSQVSLKVPGTNDASGATFTAATPGTAGSNSVEADVGSAKCFAKVQVSGAPSSSLRVVVADEATGQPINDATVVVGSTAVSSGTNGEYSVATVSASNDIHVFHQKYGYVSFIGVSSKDLFVSLQRNPTDNYGGFKGSFTSFPSDQVHIGIAAASISGSFTDLNLEQLLGAWEPMSLSLGGQSYGPFNVPAGIVLGFGGTMGKGIYKGLGSPGICADAAKTAAGTCGTRSAWGVAGDVPLSKIAPLAGQLKNAQNLNVGKVLATLLPEFRNFSSGISRDVSFDMAPGVSGGPDFANDLAFPAVNLKASVPLSLKFPLTIPQLPAMGVDGTGKIIYADAAMVLGGAMVAGRGLLPLGLAVGVDVDDAHPVPNRLVGDANDGVISLRMAPNHDGTERSTYGLVALAASFNGLTTGSGLSASGLVRLDSKYDYDVPVTYGGAGFPALVSGAKYDYASGLFTPPSGLGAGVYRVVFTDGLNHRWTVFFGGSGSFALPVPTGFDDRTLDTAGARPGASFNIDGPARSGYSVQSLVLSGGATLEPLVTFNDRNMDNLVRLTSGFAVTEVAAPKAKILSPLANATVTATPVVNVELGSFSPPTDGTVRLVCDAGVACGSSGTAAPVDGKIDVAVSSALLSGTHVIRAVLYDAAGLPLNPPAVAKISVTVP